MIFFRMSQFLRQIFALLVACFQLIFCTKQNFACVENRIQIMVTGGDIVEQPENNDTPDHYFEHCSDKKKSFLRDPMRH